MKDPRIAVHSAIASVLAVSFAAVGEPVAAEDKIDMVKCYGIVKAGKNDCQTADGSCAGTAKVDAQGDAWILIPKGTCEKIVGASRKPQTENDITRVNTGG